MPKPFLSGRIPNDLMTEIDRYCLDNNISRTKVMVDALRQYLSCPEPQTQVDLNQLDENTDRIDDLQSGYDMLWRKLCELEDEVRKLSASGHEKEDGSSSELTQPNQLELFRRELKSNEIFQT